MKISEARGFYVEFSGKLSELVRNLCFAGIAIVWIFANTETAGNISIPNELIWPLIFLVFSLISDLCQYLFSTIMWGVYQRSKETDGVGEDEDIFAPGWINWPALMFFWSKVGFSAIGYVLLITYLLKSLQT